MASVGVAPTSGLREPSGHAVGVDKLPEEMNDMKIRDDKVCKPLVKCLSVFSPCSLFFIFWIIKCLLLNSHGLPHCRKWKPQLLMVTEQRQAI